MTETVRGCFFIASNCSQNHKSVLDAMTAVASQYFLCETAPGHSQHPSGHGNLSC